MRAMNMAKDLGPGATSAPPERPDPPTFEVLYDAHVDYLWRTARGLGISPAALEDVLQDVFMVVHRRLPELEHGGGIRTWLTRILLHVVQEHRRRFARKEDCDALPDDLADPRAGGPHEEVARGQASAILASLLDGMSEPLRTVFVLAEIEQVPAPEIADALDVGVNTVYSRLRLARTEYQRQVARVRARDAWRLR